MLHRAIGTNASDRMPAAPSARRLAVGPTPESVASQRPTTVTANTPASTHTTRRSSSTAPSPQPGNRPAIAETARYSGTTAHPYPTSDPNSPTTSCRTKPAISSATASARASP